MDHDPPDDLDWTPEQWAFLVGLDDRFEALREQRERHAAQVQRVLRDLRALSDAIK